MVSRGKKKPPPGGEYEGRPDESDASCDLSKEGVKKECFIRLLFKSDAHSLLNSYHTKQNMSSVLFTPRLDMFP